MGQIMNRIGEEISDYSNQLSHRKTKIKYVDRFNLFTYTLILLPYWIYKHGIDWFFYVLIICYPILVTYNLDFFYWIYKKFTRLIRKWKS